MKKLIFVLNFMFIFILITKGQSMSLVWGGFYPPYHYVGSQIVEIQFKTTPETIETLIPDPLEYGSGNIISISIGVLKIPSLNNYLEMYLTIPVEYNGNKGQYWALMYLEDHTSITIGRELWGFPKLGADLNFIKEDDKISASIKRYNNDLLELSADLTPPNKDIDTIKSNLAFVVKEIPAVDGSKTPALKTIKFC